LSLAIGKDGQNVRLASKLTGYRIEIEGDESLSKLPKEVEKKVEEQPVIEEVKENKDIETAKKAKEIVEEEVKVQDKKDTDLVLEEEKLDQGLESAKQEVEIKEEVKEVLEDEKS